MSATHRLAGSAVRGGAEPGVRRGPRRLDAGFAHRGLLLAILGLLFCGALVWWVVRSTDDDSGVPGREPVIRWLGVRDAEGRAAEGVRVGLVCADGTRLEATSSRSGQVQFDLTDHPGAVDASYSAADGSCAFQYLPRRIRSENPHWGWATLRPAASVTFCVADVRGAPVCGARVEFVPTYAGGSLSVVRFEPRSPPAQAVATTDESGTARLAGVPAGPWSVVVRSAGHGTEQAALTVEAGSNETAHFVLQPACGLEGRIRRAQGRDPRPVHVWAFRADQRWDVAGAEAAQHALSDENGRFRLSDLAPGTHMLVAGEPDGSPCGIGLVRVPFDGTFEVDAPEWISVPCRVRAAETDAPLEGVDVEVSWKVGSFFGRSIRTSDAGGAMTVLVPGAATSSEELPPQKGLLRTYAQPGVESVRSDRGGTCVPVEFRPRRAARVRGRVTGPDGPAGGAAVTARTARTAAPPRTAGALSDGDGDFHFDVEPGEPLTVFAARDGLVSEPPTEISAADLEQSARDGMEVRVDLSLAPGCGIVGDVTDARGAPIPGMRVLAWGRGPPGFATTGPDGVYRIGGLERRGVYTVVVDHAYEGNERTETSVTPDFPSVRAATLRVADPRRVRFRLAGPVDLTGARVRVLAHQDSSGAPWRTRPGPVSQLTPGADEVELVVPTASRRVGLAIESPAGQIRVADVELADDRATDVRVEPFQDVTVRVTDGASEPVGRAVVSARFIGTPADRHRGVPAPPAWMPEPVAFCSTGPDGHAVVRGLQPGLWELVVRAPGFGVWRGSADAQPETPVVEARLARSRVLRRTVRRADGSCVSGARVAVQGTSRAGEAAEPVFTTTDGKGEFAVVTAAELGTVTVSPPYGGRPDIVATRAAFSEGEPQMEIVVAEGGVIEGVVTDTEGEPMAGACVTAERIDEGESSDLPSPGAFTGGDGRFRIGGIGSPAVSISAAHGTGRSARSGRVRRVTAGSTAVEIVVR